jgi:peptidoglycan/LPS O-acetylase OafA/YrhL
MFFVGAAFFVWREEITLSKRVFLLVAVLVLVSALHIPLFNVAYRLLLAYLVIYIALIPGGKIRNFNRLGDYSYGVYIYAFPVQQSIMALTGGVTVLELFFSAFFISLFLAVISWHTVEKRFLQLKGKYTSFERVFPRTVLSMCQSTSEAQRGTL